MYVGMMFWRKAHIEKKMFQWNGFLSIHLNIEKTICYWKSFNLNAAKKKYFQISEPHVGYTKSIETISSFKSPLVQSGE